MGVSNGRGISFFDNEENIISDDYFNTIMVGQWLGNGLRDQVGHVADLSLAGNNNHLLYTTTMTDTIAFGTAGYFTSGVAVAGSSAGFEVPISAFSPDTYNGGANGHSIFVSSVVNFAAYPAGLATIGGNAGDGTNNGFSWYIDNAGGVRIYTKSAGGQFQRGTTSAAIGLSTDTRISMYVDGISKGLFAWVNGKMIGNNEPLLATGSLFTADSPWWFGGGGIPARDRSTQACGWKDAAIISAPPGYYIKSPAFLDLILRNDPGRILTKEDLSR